MAHFAQIDDANTVLQVIVISNDVAVTESAGQSFIADTLKLDGVWKQTSYNTYIDNAGVSQHGTGGTPFRGCYAGIGFDYDEVNDVFIPQGYTYDAATDTFTPPPVEDAPE